MSAVAANDVNNDVLPPELVELAAGILTDGGNDLDWESIEQKLSQAPGDLIVAKGLLKSADAALRQRFLSGQPIEKLVTDRARITDLLVVSGWQHFLGEQAADITVVAVGGYGRGELLPRSDVDLLLLMPDRDKEQVAPQISEFLTFLWDLGLEVGHSTRTVKECRKECRDDLTVATTVMESRVLCGPDKLYQRMLAAVAPPDIWPVNEFFEAKLKEQQNRHHRYDDTAYNLEPNIKGSPGGLRDIQLVIWVARRYFGTGELADLVDQGFLTPAQLTLLRQGRALLWRIRFALHILTGRREDRLLFDHQMRIASMFGYEDARYTLAVEQLMQRYYRTVMDLSRLNEMLLQLFQEAILLDPEAEPRQLTPDFQVKNGFLQITDEDVFVRNPSALLEIFVVLQQNPELKGVSARTIAMVKRYLHLMDDEFRQNPRNHRLFLQIIHAPAGVTHELRRMNTYGVLGQYIPAFGRIVGRMQYDLFHAYTVDAHTLFVVSNLRRFALRRFDHEFPHCSEIMQNLDKPELAYLAGLFHDIAKGRGGDHSELGAVDAKTFCLEHGMSPEDAELVAWLVGNHLQLSLTAQKKDTNDPAVIAEFAGIVGDQKRLDYLYLLTHADVRSTNPKLWNSWKASLFKELYEGTKRRLSRGKPADKDEVLGSRRARTLSLADADAISSAEAEKRWQAFGDDYFLIFKPDEIARHTSLLREFESSDANTAIGLLQGDSGVKVLIHAPQEQYTFALATALFDELGLNVVDARIMPLADDYSLSVYTVLEQDGSPLEDTDRMNAMQERMAATLNGERETRVTRRVARQARMFHTPTLVRFAADNQRGRTVLELITGDRPGLLSQVSEVFRQQGALIQNARIVTVGERAEDVFYITDDDENPLSEELKKELSEALIESLAPEQLG